MAYKRKPLFGHIGGEREASGILGFWPRGVLCLERKFFTMELSVNQLIARCKGKGVRHGFGVFHHRPGCQVRCPH